MDKPSKKSVSDLINKVAGQRIINENQLEKIMMGAKKKLDANGMDGFLEYMRDITKAPVTTEWMKGIMNQLKSPEGMKRVMKQYNLSFNLNKKRKINVLKSGKARAKRKRSS